MEYALKLFIRNADAVNPRLFVYAGYSPEAFSGMHAQLTVPFDGTRIAGKINDVFHLDRW
jgi:hypothetical protein